MAEKITLDFNWDELFPGTPVEIAEGAVIYIKPLPLGQLVKLVKFLKPILAELEEKGISIDSLDSMSAIPTVIEVVAAKFPGLISDILMIDERDVSKLPIGVIIELLVAALKENIRSKGSLEKNFQSLVGMVMQAVTEELQGSATSPKS